MKKVNKVFLVYVVVILAIIFVGERGFSREGDGGFSFSIINTVKADPYAEVLDDFGVGGASSRCKCQFFTFEPKCINGYVLSIQKNCASDNMPSALCSVWNSKCN